MHASLCIGIAILLAFAAGSTESEFPKSAAAPHPAASQPTAEQLAAWIKDYVELRYKAATEKGRELVNLFRTRTTEVLNVCGVTKSWKEALLAMKPGGKVLLAVSTAAKDEKLDGKHDVPWKATLLFEIELVRTVPETKVRPAYGSSSGGPGGWNDALGL